MATPTPSVVGEPALPRIARPTKPPMNNEVIAMSLWSRDLTLCLMLKSFGSFIRSTHIVVRTTACSGEKEVGYRSCRIHTGGAKLGVQPFA